MDRHRKSIRLRNYDYSQPGGYFITICTKGRKCFLGEIYNERMNLSDVGQIVRDCWLGIPEHFKNVELDEWVIMPNHIHGIIIIIEPVGTDYNLYLQQNRFQHITPKSLSYIIATFKSAVSRQVNGGGTGNDFAWQSRFYEHIIRNEKELSQIRGYIFNNPLKWEIDRENPQSKNFNLDHDTYWKEVYG